jgi:hypothetical protein
VDSKDIGLCLIRNGYTHVIFRVTVNEGEDVIEKIATEVNGHMEHFFPGV